MSLSEMKLTNEQKQEATKFVKQHCHRVFYLLCRLATEVTQRGSTHDEDKLVGDFAQSFLKGVFVFPKLEYGSEEYKQALEEIRPAVENHYAKNRHHPEYFADDVSGMNVVDLMEMVCDWKAASERQDGGSIEKTLEVNSKRFNLSDDLLSIIKNTLELLEND